MADEAPKKSKKTLIFIIGGVLAVGAAAFVFLGGGGGSEAEAAAVTTTLVPVEGPVIEADQMTVNLADPDARYARVKFAVVLPEGGDSAAVGERFPILKDSILSVLSGYEAADLKGADALDELRRAFTDKAFEVYEEGEVLRVVITELLVQ